ncbi:MAG: hypothetical protein AAGI91_15245 [Bacteroidota bacterium]
MRHLLLSLLLATPALAQLSDDTRAETEARISAVLDDVVTLARAGDAEALAPHLACFGPGRTFFPCDLAAEPERVTGLMKQTVETFGYDTPYVPDAYRTKREGSEELHLFQVKVRRPAQTTLTYLTFVEADGRFLFGEVITTRAAFSSELDAGDPAEARVKRRTEELLRLAGAGLFADAAPYIGCYAEEGDGYRVWPCTYDTDADRARVDGFVQRLQTLIQAAGPAGYGFEHYGTDTEREGTWHVLHVGFLKNGTPGGGTDIVYASFMEIDGQFRLGDLDDE